RLDKMAGIGDDPCVTAFFPNELTLNQQRICPRNSSNYVVRGIDEFGARVTLDNDIANMLVFNDTRNLWEYKHGAYRKWLVAVSCATA
ncbi:hypothetical protein PMAYCL1PPCAC_08048, partial [Pristionchus mayeri]